VLVFAPKYRHQVVGSRHLEPMERSMRVCADFGAALREFNGGAKHLHLVSFPLTVAIF
jgi:putative transposase